MPQLTLYLDGETEKQVKRAARAAGMSKSRWVAELIRSKTDDEWPAHIGALAGAWPEFPEVEELRAGDGVDHLREPLD